jgi:streptomycin 6-kinase
VRLLRADPARGALLLAPLGRQLVEVGLPVRDEIAVICGPLAEVSAVLPGAGLPTGADHGRALAALIAAEWDARGRPGPAAVATAAIACAERRADAHDPATAVLAYGDAHAWNTLEDPDPHELARVSSDRRRFRAPVRVGGHAELQADHPVELEPRGEGGQLGASGPSAAAGSTPSSWWRATTTRAPEAQSAVTSTRPTSRSPTRNRSTK